MYAGKGGEWKSWEREGKGKGEFSGTVQPGDAYGHLATSNRFPRSHAGGSSMEGPELRGLPCHQRSKLGQMSDGQDWVVDKPPAMVPHVASQLASVICGTGSVTPLHSSQHTSK